MSNSSKRSRYAELIRLRWATSYAHEVAPPPKEKRIQIQRNLCDSKGFTHTHTHCPRSKLGRARISSQPLRWKKRTGQEWVANEGLVREDCEIMGLLSKATSTDSKPVCQATAIWWFDAKNLPYGEPANFPSISPSQLFFPNA